jgi:SAM-dependent methyltransferase
LKQAAGEFIMFADADDRLLPRAVEANLECFRLHPEAGFVSGGYRRIGVHGGFLTEPEPTTDVGDAYERLLQGNYIGMHGTVMYRREVLLEVGMFDVSLSACEDYDLYLRVCLNHSVAAHDEIIAEYRTYDESLSGDRARMLTALRRVLKRHEGRIRPSPRLRQLAQEGRDYWFAYYGRSLVEDSLRGLSRGRWIAAGRGLAAAVRFAPIPALKAVQQAVTRKVTPRFLSRLRTRLAGKTYYPGVGRVRFGDLRRTTPISFHFGFDRGLPVDRYYIEQFLSRNAAAVQGRVLEIGDNNYTLRFGGEKVTQSDVLHAVEGNSLATFVGDLAQGDHLPSNTFDCAIVTQTLQLIFEVGEALATLHRILKPGGTLLLTVPGITSISYDQWSTQWFWSFTDSSIRYLLQGLFANGDVEVSTFGNVLAATAFLQGIATQELTAAELDEHDPKYPCTIAARAVKR